MTDLALTDSDTQIERIIFEGRILVWYDEAFIKSSRRRVTDNRCQTVTSVCTIWNYAAAVVEDLEGRTQ